MILYHVPMDLQQEKSLLRQRIAERMEKLSEKDRAVESRSLCRRILELLPADAQMLCAYYPLPSEADLRPLLNILLRQGRAVYLPHFADRKLTFRRALDLDYLVTGALKIKEPPPDAQPLDPARLDLALIPGRAFDAEHYRLGRGNGGYDIWIRAQREANPATTFWGVALACQIAREVPHEARDERVNAVVTARGML